MYTFDLISNDLKNTCLMNILVELESQLSEVSGTTVLPLRVYCMTERNGEGKEMRKIWLKTRLKAFKSTFRNWMVAFHRGNTESIYRSRNGIKISLPRSLVAVTVTTFFYVNLSLSRGSTRILLSLIYGNIFSTVLYTFMFLY